MNPLNEVYLESCKPNYRSYEKVSDEITLIDNFFEDFDSAKEFLTGREKWECAPYQGYDLPGFITMFPNWVGNHLLEKYVKDNKISDVEDSYLVVCNHRYDMKYAWSASNSDYFPHIDGCKMGNMLKYICLINLNSAPVSTKFYSYKDKEYCDPEMRDDWAFYNRNIDKEIRNFYNKDDITRDEIKSFLDSKQLETKLVRTVEYKPNQAIVYPVDLFHSPNVTKEFTENNIRNLLRITFLTAINAPSKNISYA